MKKETNIATQADKELLDQLAASYPVENGFQRFIVPRLGFYSQDQVTGKGKAMKVTTEAGTFYTEVQTDEEDENGKKIWERIELGKKMEGIILFQRKQLKMYDGTTEKFTSSPIYDEDTDVIKLFCDKQEVAEGTPKDLKAKYQYKGEDGKTRSRLEENKILYVLYEGQIWQLNLRGSSMYAFLTYRKSVAPNTVVTEFSSVPREKGSTEWNQMTFKKLRPISAEELKDVVTKTDEIRQAVTMEREYFKRINTDEVKADEDFKQLSSGN